jgi:segregation and condensation protein A
MSSPAAGDARTFSLGEFQGPLDLLLFLISKNEVNIYDIPIAQITDQYLAYLEYATSVDLENLTDFYVMAATLLYIKSRMLLPVELEMDDEIEDPRQELVERLVEYQRYKKLTDLMAEEQDQAEFLMERKRTQIVLPFQDEGLWEEIAVWDLLKVFSHLISSISEEGVFDLYEQVSVNEKIALVHELLDEREEFLFSDLLVDGRSAMEVICSLLAVLELIKSRTIVVMQNRMFGDIRVRRQVNSGAH